MKNVILKIGIIILRIIYFPMKLLKKQNKIVYISRQFNNPTLDFIMLKNEIEKIDKNVKNVILTKRIEKGLLNSISYSLHMLKQMYHVATSRVVIVDTYCIVISVLKHRKDTKIIQLWHAIGAIKKFGYQTIGKPSGATKEIAQIMCMHKNYDYVLCSSKTTKEYYCKAFGVEEKEIKMIGMPRIDYLLKEKNKQIIYDEYPELKEKENILYVPTFRKGKKIELNTLINNFNSEKYNLIIKLHPLDHKKYKYNQKEGVIFENKFSSYDLLEIADKVITDYSSLGIEASLINKPIYFYMYDIEEYEKDPGLNIDFRKEEIGKYTVETPDKLLNLMEKEYDYSVLERFRNKYITVDTKDCTNKLSKFILELMKDEYKTDVEEIPSKFIKKKYSM